MDCTLNNKKPKKKRGGTLYSKSWTGWLFIMPVVIGIVVFQLFPILESFYLSFFRRYNVISPPTGFGLGNYKYMFSNEQFWKSCRITLTYTVITVPLFMVLSFLLALLLNKKTKFISVYRVLIYLPVIIPVTVSGIIWKNFFDFKFGFANEILNRLGFEASPFFSDRLTAMPTLIFLGLWGLGGGMILWLSALKNVPKSLYEAAEIDGANKFQQLLHVTVPMCSSMIFYYLIINIIGSLQTFGSVKAITGSSAGPDDSLLFYLIKVYNDAFNIQAKTMGLACAESWFLFIVIALLTVLLFKTSGWVFYGENE